MMILPVALAVLGTALVLGLLLLSLPSSNAKESDGCLLVLFGIGGFSAIGLMYLGKYVL